MAKNKVLIDIIIDDKGTTKKVEVSTKKLSKALDKAGISAASVDRRLKGAAQASSGASKNFSKMSQGITGGLVPAYATLAATIFAVGAAFRFLQDAGDLRQLREGQVAYASFTGIALRSLTEDIQAATGAQLKFTEAAQGAAIGTAAGLSARQLVELSTAAKDISAVLGRDLTDSYNRLIRGVTKAEPELLDELGIVLRLKTATEKYAASVNKSAAELTAFERTQAVSNEVLEQTASKFGAIAAIDGTNVNQFRVLAVTFDNLVLSIKDFVSNFEVVAKFLAENPFTALLVALPFFASIFKTVLVGAGLNMANFAKNIEKQSKKAASVLKKNIGQIQQNIDKAFLASGNEKAITFIKKDAEAALTRTLKKLPELNKGFKTLQQTGTGGIQTFQRALVSLDKGTNGFGAATKAQAKIIRRSLNSLIEANIAASGKLGFTWKTFVARMKGYALTTQKAWVTAFGRIKVAGTKAAAAIGAAFFKIFKFVLIFELIWNAIPESIRESIRETAGLSDAIGSTARDAIDALTTLGSEYSKFAETQRKITENAEGSLTLDNLIGFGNVLETLPAEEFAIALGALNQAREDFNNGEFKRIDIAKNFAQKPETFEELIDVRDLESINDLYNNLTQGINESALAQLDFARAFEAAIKTGDVKALENIRERVRGITLAGQNLKNTYEETATSIRTTLLGAAPTTQFTAAINLATGAIKDLKTVTGDGLFPGLEQEKKDLALQERNLERLIHLDSQAFKVKERALAVELKRNKGLLGATQLQSTRLGQLIQEQQIQAELANIQDKITTAKINEAEAGKDPARLEQARRSLVIAQQELEVAKAKEEVIKRQLSNAGQLVDSFNNSFESGLSKGLDEIITGKETSFKEAGLVFAKGILEGLSKTLSKLLTEQIVGFLNIGNDPIKNNTEALKIVTESLDTNSNKLTDLTNAVSSFQPGDLVIDKGQPQTGARPVPEINPVVSRTAGSASGDDLTNASRPLKSFFVNPKGVTGVGEGDNKTEFIGDRKGGIFDPFLNAFEQLLNPEAAWIQKIGGLFSALPQSLGSLFQNIGGLFSGQFNLGNAAGGLSGFISNLFANGGMASGGFRAFAAGGIASEPTLGMIGEGKFDEAVVPLPNGNAIPVDLRGVGSGTSNVSVNINMADGSVNTTGDGDSIARFGNTIADLVQREIADQTRPGGLLARQ